MGDLLGEELWKSQASRGATGEAIQAAKTPEHVQSSLAVCRGLFASSYLSAVDRIFVPLTHIHMWKS